MFGRAGYTPTVVFPSTPRALISQKLTVTVDVTGARCSGGARCGVPGWWHGWVVYPGVVGMVGRCGPWWYPVVWVRVVPVPTVLLYFPTVWLISRCLADFPTVWLVSRCLAVFPLFYWFWLYFHCFTGFWLYWDHCGCTGPTVAVLGPLWTPWWPHWDSLVALLGLPGYQGWA